jgi:predicted lipid-binding transport protein (Tim44 family)
MPGPNPERREAEAAAAEAAAIGGRTSSESPSAEGAPDETERPLAEAGQREAEGFEQAEQELVEHASHGDQHAARRVIEESPEEADDARATDAGEPDEERSSERVEDLP